MCLNFMFIREIKIEEKKIKINQIFNATDDRLLAAADKARPISIEFATSFAMHYG